MTPRLPPPATPGRYRVALVCLGNICRSPMAEVVLGDLMDRAGLSDRVRVRSAGTGDWHVGGPMDRRAAASLVADDRDPAGHRAQQVRPAWLDPADEDGDDLVLAMDADNLADLRALVGPFEAGGDPGGDPGGDAGAGTPRLRLFRDFDPVDPGGDVPDPYYGGDHGFQEVLAMVERTGAAIVAALQRELEA